MISPLKHILNVKRYYVSSADRSEKIRLDLNENVVPFPENFLRDVLASAPPSFASTYPRYDRLYRKLSSALGVPEDHLLLTNGSDSASKLTFEGYVGPGQKVILTRPTFAMHKIYAQLAQASIQEISYRGDYSFPAEEFLGALVPGTRLAIIVNPVNPVGTTVSPGDLRRILEKCVANDTLCMVDEAYVEHYGISALPLLSEFPNLIVTRTFSKTFGLAAFRIGYAVARPDVIAAIRTSQPTFDVNQIAVLFAEYLLDHPQIVKDMMAKVREGRVFLREELRKLGLPIISGETNFLLVDLGSRKQQVVDAMERAGILVASKFDLPGLENVIRVTLGPKDLMQMFLDTLKKALS